MPLGDVRRRPTPSTHTPQLHRARCSPPPRRGRRRGRSRARARRIDLAGAAAAPPALKAATLDMLAAKAAAANASAAAAKASAAALKQALLHKFDPPANATPAATPAPVVPPCGRLAEYATFTTAGANAGSFSTPDNIFAGTYTNGGSPIAQFASTSASNTLGASTPWGAIGARFKPRRRGVGGNGHGVGPKKLFNGGRGRARGDRVARRKLGVRRRFEQGLPARVGSPG